MSDNLWADNPELQARYNRVSAQTRRLQQELGIEPLTLEQRYQRYLKRQQEEQLHKEELERRKRELEKLQSIKKPSLTLRRPGK